MDDNQPKVIGGVVYRENPDTLKKPQRQPAQKVVYVREPAPVQRPISRIPRTHRSSSYRVVRPQPAPVAPKKTGPGYFEGLKIQRAEKAKEEEERKKNEQEINAKMEKERIAAERATAVEQIKRQEQKRELMQKSAEFERKQAADRMRVNVAKPAPVPRAEPEQKISPAEMQQAREDYVTGE